MKYTYATKGTCSHRIDIEAENGIVKEVRFHGGCNGNLKGISLLISGMTVDEVIRRFDGISCGARMTSCPDQLAQALKKIKERA